MLDWIASTILIEKGAKSHSIMDAEYIEETTY